MTTDQIAILLAVTVGALSIVAILLGVALYLADDQDDRLIRKLDQDD